MFCILSISDFKRAYAKNTKAVRVCQQLWNDVFKSISTEGFEKHQSFCIPVSNKLLSGGTQACYDYVLTIINQDQADFNASTLCNLLASSAEKLRIAYPGLRQTPFKQDPVSFTKYLNSLKWEDGDKVYFQGLGKCTNSNTMSTYGCGAGYVTISNPLGTKICVLQRKSSLFNNFAVYYDAKSQVRFNWGECRYQ
jgi:hypothetical protein